MTNNTYKIFYILPLLLLTSIMAQANPAYTWKKKIDYVAVTTLKGANKNNHPKAIPVEKIARLLSHITVVTGSKKIPKKRVFTDHEIELLGNAVSEALLQVKPNEVIIFSISDLRSSIIGRKRLSTSGTIFIHGDQLNLLLGSIHRDLETKKLRTGITGNYGPLKNDLDTGSVRRDPEHDWRISTFTGATHVNNRSDWLSINLSQSYDYALQDKLAEPHTDVKYLTEKQKITAKDTLEARIKKLEQGSTASKPVTNSSIETRLRRLQHLYEKGALPEAMYLEKVREIMTEL